MRRHTILLLIAAANVMTSGTPAFAGPGALCLRICTDGCDTQLGFCRSQPAERTTLCPQYHSYCRQKCHQDCNPRLR